MVPVVVERDQRTRAARVASSSSSSLLRDAAADEESAATGGGGGGDFRMKRRNIKGRFLRMTAAAAVSLPAFKTLG